MRHQTLDELSKIANVRKSAMDRAQRLERWAQQLERQPDRVLCALERTEYVGRGERANLRRDNSPISIAFEDMLLQQDGLRDDSYGEAKRFFELTDRQLHSIVCDCHVGRTMSADRAAACVRISARTNLWGRCMQLLGL